MITDQDMERLAELAGRASKHKRRWRAFDGQRGLELQEVGPGWVRALLYTDAGTEHVDGDADEMWFIAAAAPSAILSLIERVKEAEARLGLTMAFVDTECAEAQHYAENAMANGHDLESHLWAARARTLAEVAGRLRRATKEASNGTQQR